MDFECVRMCGSLHKHCVFVLMGTQPLAVHMTRQVLADESVFVPPALLALQKRELPGAADLKPAWLGFQVGLRNLGAVGCSGLGWKP